VGHRVWLCIAGLVVGSSLLAAAASAVPAPAKGGTLRISSPIDLDSVDPAIGYLGITWMLEFATCAKLYNYPDKPGPAGAIVIPEVAAGFPKISRDGRTQTIQLTRSFRFHTGARVTAANFVAAFNRDANPKLQSPATNYLHEIVGGDAVIAGKTQTISGVKALSPYVLQIHTTRPLPDLVSRLTMPFFCPVAVNTPLEEIDDPLGSGPYYVAAHVPNREIVLERNPYYRGSRPANVDRVVWTIGLGQAACRQAVEQDEVDYCTQLLASDYQELAAKYGINRRNGQFFFNPQFFQEYFAFNHDRPAFKGPDQIPLMKAINWAIDRHALVQAAGYLGGKRTDQILPEALGRKASIYPLGAVTPRSLSKARALLAKARFKPKTLVFYVATGAGPGALENVWAQIFQFDLKRLGIDVELKYFSFSEATARTSTRGEPFDVAIQAWAPDYADGASFFRPLFYGPGITQSGNENIAYLDRPYLNRAIDRIDLLTGSARRKAWADLDVKLMQSDPPVAPFIQLAARDFVSKSFGCYVSQPAVGRPDFAAACKK
jgi:ABC-type oligopeptide transport system substrate-binding subunit